MNVSNRREKILLPKLYCSTFRSFCPSLPSNTLSSRPSPEHMSNGPINISLVRPPNRSPSCSLSSIGSYDDDDDDNIFKRLYRDIKIYETIFVDDEHK